MGEQVLVWEWVRVQLYVYFIGGRVDCIGNG